MAAVAFGSTFFYIRSCSLAKLTQSVASLTLSVSVFFSGFTAGAAVDRQSVFLPLAWPVAVAAVLDNQLAQRRVDLTHLGDPMDAQAYATYSTSQLLDGNVQC